MTAKEKLDIIEAQVLASIRGKVLAINSQQERLDSIRKQIEDNPNDEKLLEKCTITKFLQDTNLTELNGMKESAKVVLDIIYNYEIGKASAMIFDEENNLTDDITVLLRNS